LIFQFLSSPEKTIEIICLCKTLILEFNSIIMGKIVSSIFFKILLFIEWAFCLSRILDNIQNVRNVFCENMIQLNPFEFENWMHTNTTILFSYLLPYYMKSYGKNPETKIRENWRIWNWSCHSMSWQPRVLWAVPGIISYEEEGNWQHK